VHDRQPLHFCRLRSRNFPFAWVRHCSARSADQKLRHRGAIDLDPATGPGRNLDPTRLVPYRFGQYRHPDRMSDWSSSRSGGIGLRPGGLSGSVAIKCKDAAKADTGPPDMRTVLPCPGGTASQRVPRGYCPFFSLDHWWEVPSLHQRVRLTSELRGCVRQGPPPPAARQSRAARCRSGTARRHRQRPHADPGRTGQGRQGSVCHAVAAAARHAAHWHCQLKQGWDPPAVGGAAVRSEKSLARL
jgi:hypothetical protein